MKDCAIYEEGTGTRIACEHQRQQTINTIGVIIAVVLAILIITSVLARLIVKK